MKTYPCPHLFRAARAVLAVCALSAAARGEAQTSDAPSAEETVVLSPFEVQAERDSGYVATNTLAGSRLNTSLRDTPASISVMTKDFLDDIGAVSVSQAMQYALNAGPDVGGGGANVAATTGNGLMENSFNLQIRGFRQATQTRDFFTTILDGDVFNLERIDIARGPNSILFGIGGPGGIVNTTTKRARLDDNSTTLTWRTGSWNRNRGMLDANRELIDGRLAARVNLLYQQSDGYRDFEEDNQRRGALALTWRPTSSTTVRLGVEGGRVHQNRARPWMPFEQFSAWEFWGRHYVEYGTPESPWTIDDTRYAQKRSSSGSAAPDNGLPPITDPVYGPELRTAGHRISSTGRVAMMTGPLAGKILYVGTQANGESYYRTSAANNIGGYNTPANVEDETIFPRTGNIMGPGNFTEWEYHSGGATVEQRIGERLFVEAAFNSTVTDRLMQQVTPFANYALQYDVTSTLPSFNNDRTYDATRGGPETTGQGVGALNFNRIVPNPLVGEIILLAQPSYSETQTMRDDARLSASYQLDLGRFGRHMVLGFASLAETGTERENYAEANLHPQRPASSVFSNIPLRAYHINPFSAELFERGMRDPFKEPLESGPIWGRPEEGFEGAFMRNSWSRSKNKIDSAALALHSRYFGDRLVTTLGVRRDRIRTWNHTQVRDSVTQVVTGLTPPTAAAVDESGNTYTIGAVYHVPRLEWLSVFANKSTNFRDQSGAQYLEDEDLRPNLEIGPLEGTGIDYGVKLGFLDGRINATITRFQVDLDKQVFSHQGNVFNYVNAIWTTILNGGPNTVDPDETHPQGHRFGGRDTRSQRSEGWELELTANPTRQWRVSFNLSHAENTVSRLGRALEVYMNKHRAEWEAHADLAYDTTRSPGFLTNPGGSNTVGSLIYGLDELLAFVKAGEGQIETNIRPWNANLFTAYTFSEGWLKGLTLGGGVNYRGDAVLGTRPPTLQDPTFETFKGGDYILVNAMASYSFRLHDKFDVRVQLNVDNVLNNEDRQVLASNWNPMIGGLETFHYYFEPRSFSLSTTLSF